MQFEAPAPLADLIMRHKGKRICVMGGGPTLDADIANVKADVWISVNDHGARRREVDYVVCMDNIHTKNQQEMRKFLRKYSDAPIISPWHWGQFQMLRWPDYPCLFNSDIIASWIASIMGGHPIIMAGFDCYGGRGRQLEMHRQYVKHIKGYVRVCSGILLEYYQQYDPKERLGKYEPPDVFKEATEGFIKVRVDHPFHYRGYQWPPGTVLTVGEYEVRRQLKHKSIVRVE